MRALLASPLLWRYISMPPVVPSPGMEGGLIGRMIPSRTCEKCLCASMMTALRVLAANVLG